MAEKEKKQGISIQNRKARHEYHILESFAAGMSLTGTEIKSIRGGNASISEAYCFLSHGEVWIKNMHIGIFKQGTYNNHEPLRDRKLLLTKREIRKIEKGLLEQGVTLIPLKIFDSPTGYAKLEIALAKGKKMFDKREDIKKRDAEREIQRRL